MNKDKIDLVLSFLKEQKQIDFTGCSPEMLERRITRRFIPTNTIDFIGYLEYLMTHNEELEQLVQTITIKVSHFFRNPHDFEILGKIIAAKLNAKRQSNDPLRIWSAGCATGEEVYSIAILIDAYNSQDAGDINIFATDIDTAAIENAKAGIYNADAVKEVKYGLLQKYFTQKGDKFHISDRIKNMVNFSRFDLLTHQSVVPPESVYGSFDIVSCRNVLIYYDLNSQNLIWQKLFRSLAKSGYVFLGEAETPSEDYRHSLKRVSPEAKIYRRLL